MEREGHFVLPLVPKYQRNAPRPKRLPEAVATPVDVPAKARLLQGLRLIVVKSERQMRTWNEMMNQGHPQGAEPLVGLGWDLQVRRSQLHRVVGLSRFLIRSQVGSHNLAARVLSLGVSQSPGDFEDHCEFRPWLLETFVDREGAAGKSKKDI